MEVTADVNDWLLDRALFHELSSSHGPFTLDAAADDLGYTKQMTPYCCPSNSFLQRELRSEHIWAFFPPGRLLDFLGHYQRQKAIDPSNSGVFVLPKWTAAPWWNSVAHWTVLREYPAGTDLFTAPQPSERAEDIRIGKTPWAVVILLDPPARALATAALPAPKLAIPAPSTARHGPPRAAPAQKSAMRCEKSGLQPTISGYARRPRRLLAFRGAVDGTAANILVDTGAQLDLLSSEFVERNGIPTQTGPTVNLTMANEDVHSANATTTASLPCLRTFWPRQLLPVCQLSLQASALIVTHEDMLDPE